MIGYVKYFTINRDAECGVRGGGGWARWLGVGGFAGGRSLCVWYAGVSTALVCHACGTAQRPKEARGVALGRVGGAMAGSAVPGLILLLQRGGAE